jgi:hypothetical protein
MTQKLKKIYKHLNIYITTNWCKMEKVGQSINREDDYFKKSASWLATRANLTDVKCYVDKVPGKTHLRKFIYKQPYSAQVVIVLTRSALSSGHTMIAALLEGASKLALNKPDMPKIIIGKLPGQIIKKPSKYKGKKPNGYHRKPKKMSKKASDKQQNASEVKPRNKKNLNYRPMKTKKRHKQ